MIKVAVDVSAKIVNPAGTATYIRELFKAIPETERSLSLEEIQFEPSFKRSNRILRKYDTLNRELFWLNKTLPKIIQERKCDLLHSPAMMAPRRCPVPYVLTVFDLYYLHEPGAFTSWQRLSLRHSLPRSLSNADGIITISRFTKSEILKFFPDIPEDKIKITRLGVSDLFRPQNVEDIESFKKGERIDRPFLLSVATIEPRKNLKRILKAFALVKNKIPHDLHIAGARGWKTHNLSHLIHSLDIEDRVKVHNFIPVEKLVFLYNSAEMLIFPSLFEGFGLPVLEAMACGCPVITSNTASLPEVAGEAAITVDPLETAQIVDAIRFLVEDSGKVRTLRAEGLEHVRNFSWKRCAAETAEIYRSVLNRK